MSEAMKTATDKSHLLALDSLRGLAAVSMIVHHVSWLTPISGNNFVQNVYLMVDFFFVLSGFVISYAYFGRLNTPRQAVRFMWLRFWRLWPLHAFFLAVFGVMIALKHSFNTHALVTNILLIQGVYTEKTLTYNPFAWSISTEFWVYLLFTLLALFFQRRAILIAIAGTLSILAMAYLSTNSLVAIYGMGDPVAFGPIRCIAGFMAGVVLYAIYYANAEKLSGAARPVLNWLAITSTVAFVAFIALATEGATDVVIYPLSAFMILFVALTPNAPFTRALNSKPLLFLGAASYSIYLSHSFVIVIVRAALRALLHATEQHSWMCGCSMLIVPPWIGGIAELITVIAVIGLSALTYRYIETPLRNWSRTALAARNNQAAS